MADEIQKPKKKNAAEKEDIFEPPVLKREPSAKQVSLGGRLALRITATGRPMPSYQWYLNGKKISGATSDRYMVNKTRREHAGNYTCEAKNYVGKVMSRSAMVSFLVERVPNLVIEPAFAEIPVGQPFKFVITGVPADRLKKLNLQWTFNGKRINGAKGGELEFTEVKKKYEGEYKVLLFIGGDMRSSAKVTLKVAGAEAQARKISSAEAPAPKPAPADDFFFNPEEDESPTAEPRAEESTGSPAFSLSLSDLLPDQALEASSPEASIYEIAPAAKNRKAQRKKQKLEKMLSYWQAIRAEKNAA